MSCPRCNGQLYHTVGELACQHCGAQHLCLDRAWRVGVNVRSMTSLRLGLEHAAEVQKWREREDVTDDESAPMDFPAMMESMVRGREAKVRRMDKKIRGVSNAGPALRAQPARTA